MNLFPPLPKSIDIEPTIRCNFRCKMCQRTYWNRKAEDLSFDNFKRIVCSFPDLKEIKLQGMGEPFLNPELFRMVEYSKSKDIKVVIYSNASLFHYDSIFEQLIDSHIDLLRISLDSGNKERYESIRVGASFEQVISNIRKITNENKSIKNIELWTLLMNPNFSDIPQIINIAHECGINTINIQLILNTFDYKEEVGDVISQLQSNKRNLEKATFDNWIDYAVKKTINLKFAYSKAYSPSRVCHWAFDKAFISVEGYVVPCCTIADPNVINFGNIFDIPFETIWNSEKYVAFRQKILLNQLYLPCQNCYSNQHQEMLSNVF